MVQQKRKHERVNDEAAWSQGAGALKVEEQGTAEAYDEEEKAKQTTSLGMLLPVTEAKRVDAADDAAVHRLYEWLKPLEAAMPKDPRSSMQAERPEDLKQGDRLDLRRLGLAHLPGEIRCLASVKVLFLEENIISALPPELGDLGELENLSLGRNRLLSLPKEIGRLAKLKHLHLRENKLLALPPEVGALQALVELNAGKNCLQSIPKEVGQLRNLWSLQLEDNQLQAIPAELGNLMNLGYLFLQNNQLRCLPKELNGLTKLKNFNVQSNGIRGEFPLRPLFDHMANNSCLEIHVSGNHFEAVDLGEESCTIGTLHEPISKIDGFGYRRSSICMASFCRTEALDWQLMIRRIGLQNEPWWSQLCVSFPDGAEATQDHQTPSEDFGSYLDAVSTFTCGRSAQAQEKFGCSWFQRWTYNINRALQLGHRHFVVITKMDRIVGVTQSVEWLYLLKCKEGFPDLRLSCASVEDSMNVLDSGMYEFCDVFFDSPVGLPESLGSDLSAFLTLGKASPEA